MIHKPIRVTCLVFNKSIKDKPKVVSNSKKYGQKNIYKQYGVLSYKVVCEIHLAFKAIKV